MTPFNTLHIFEFGDVQLITKEVNVIKKSETLTKLQAVIDDVWGKKPAGNNSTSDYHAINIFDGMFADFQPKTKGEKGYRIKFGQLNVDALNDLVDEMLA